MGTTKLSAAELAELDREDTLDRREDARAVQAGDLTQEEADKRETARARALARQNAAKEAAPPTRVAAEATAKPGPFEQPATLGVVNAEGRPVKVLTIPTIPEGWQPQTAELVMRDGSVALAIPLTLDDDAATIGDKLEQLRLAVWHVKHGVTTPASAAPVVGQACPTCGAPEWAKNDARKAA